MEMLPSFDAVTRMIKNGCSRAEIVGKFSREGYNSESVDAIVKILSIEIACDCDKMNKSRKGRSWRESPVGFNSGTIYYPYNIKQPDIPVMVVSGPPCSGKSLYAEKHMAPADCILDTDVIVSELSGMPIYQAPNEIWMDRAIIERNRRLSRLPQRYNRVWIISTSAQKWQRDFWRDRFGATVYVMETPALECVRRYGLDVRRNQSAQARSDACSRITSWWSKYERSSLDVVIKPNKHF